MELENALSYTHDLECQCSTLNYDLYRVNLKEVPSCTCGSPCENAFHFFFESDMYNVQRHELLNSLRNFDRISIDLLMSGDPTLPLENNIFQKVQQFIQTTGRF